MPEKSSNVSMRIRIGDNELEVSGPSDFVERKIEDFLKKHKDIVARPMATPSKAMALSSSGEQILDKKLSVAQFFRKKAAKSDVDRVLLAGYYLEKYQGVENFTAAELREIIRNAKITPPKNPNDTVAQNIKKGLMMSAGDKDGKMAFVLTSDGEDIVTQTIQAA